jgi:hypothetical protein
MDPSSSRWDWLPPEIQEIILDQAAWMHWKEEMRHVRYHLLTVWAQRQYPLYGWHPVMQIDMDRIDNYCVLCRCRIPKFTLPVFCLLSGFEEVGENDCYSVHRSCAKQFIADKKASSS